MFSRSTTNMCSSTCQLRWTLSTNWRTSFHDVTSLFPANVTSVVRSPETICVNVCMCASVCIDKYSQLCVFVHAFVCVRACVHLWVCMCTCTCTCVCACVCACVRVCPCACLCV